MANLIDELLIGLGFDFDDKETKEFISSSKDVLAALGGIATKAYSAALSVFAYSKSLAQTTDVAGRFSDKIGISIEEISALEYAQAQITGSSDGMTEALMGLQQGLQDASMGLGDHAKWLGIANVSWHNADNSIKTVSEVLGELADEIGGMENVAKQTQLVRHLGLEDIGMLLREGSSGLKQLQEEAKNLVITEEQADSTREFDKSWQHLLATTTAYGRQLNQVLLPMFMSLFQWVEMVMAKISLFAVGLDLMVQKFGGWEQVLKAVKWALAGLVTLKVLKWFGALGAIVAKIGGWGVFLKGLAKVVARFVAFVGVLYAIQDLYEYFTGGDSLFGRWIKDYPEAKAQIDQIAGTLANMARLVVDIDFWNSMGGDLGVWIYDTEQKVKAMVDRLVAYIKEIPSRLMDSVNEIGASMTTHPLKRLMNELGDRFAEMGDKNMKQLKIDFPWFFPDKKPAVKVEQILMGTGDVPYGVSDIAKPTPDFGISGGKNGSSRSSNTNNSNSSKSINNKIEIKIDANTSDAERIGEVVERKVKVVLNELTQTTWSETSTPMLS